MKRSACFSQDSLCASALQCILWLLSPFENQKHLNPWRLLVKEVWFFRYWPPTIPITLETRIIISCTPPWPFMSLRIFIIAVCCCLSEHTIDLYAILKVWTSFRAHPTSAVLKRSTKASFQIFPHGFYLIKLKPHLEIKSDAFWQLN